MSLIFRKNSNQKCRFRPLIGVLGSWKWLFSGFRGPTRWVGVLWFVCAGAMAQGAGEPLYGVFSLSSEATASVENDLMTATLVVQAENKDSAALADEINRTMAWAVEQLRGQDSLDIRTQDYQTYPRYDTSQSRRLIGWRASQTIRLQSDDFEAASQAIQALQERLQVQNITLSTKPETRSRAVDELIDRALTAFKQRARVVQENMNASAYRILDMDIQTGQSMMPMIEARAPVTSMVRSSAVAEPVIESGTSQVEVRVMGRIQLSSD